MGDTDGIPRVIYEDPSLVAVRKPARMHSAPGLGADDLCAWVFARYPDAAMAGALVGEGTAGAAARRRSSLEGGLLHRLDYETSGIVLFARTVDAFASVLRQQEGGTFYKEYLAFSTVSAENLPLGSWPPRGFPGGTDEAAWDEARETLDGGALAAMLGEGEEASRGRFRIDSSFRAFGPKGSRVACLGPVSAAAGPCRREAEAKPRYSSDILACSDRGSSMEVRMGLSRGFRHQVRAQLAWVGLPISGDLLYGGRPDERLRLYAVGLSLKHPLTGETLSLRSDP